MFYFYESSEAANGREDKAVVLLRDDIEKRGVAVSCCVKTLCHASLFNRKQKSSLENEGFTFYRLNRLKNFKLFKQGDFKNYFAVLPDDRFAPLDFNLLERCATALKS